METIRIETADASRQFATIQNDNLTLENISGKMNEIMRNVNILKSLEEISQHTGNYVRLLPELSFMPALIGSDNQPVFLYRIIEAIDEYLDIDKIQDDFSNLSYSQIAGSIFFLRKVAQMNSQKIDIDDLEDEFELSDPDFLHTLEMAFNDKEVVRVLSQPE